MVEGESFLCYKLFSDLHTHTLWNINVYVCMYSHMLMSMGIITYYMFPSFIGYVYLLAISIKLYSKRTDT